MNCEVQRFLDSLGTARRIDSALEAVVNSSASTCARDLASYAHSHGYYFSSSEAACWLTDFQDSISDSLLRNRYHQMRLRQCNDWAAFLALEREMKIDVPDEELLGDRWGLCEPGVDQPDGKMIDRLCRRLACLLGIK